MLLPGRSLRGIGCRYVPPAFRHSNIRRQVPPRLHDAIDSSNERWNYGREYYPANLAENDDFHAILGSFTIPQITTWDRRLYFLSEGRRAEDLFRPEKSDGFGRDWTRELGYQWPAQKKKSPHNRYSVAHDSKQKQRLSS